MSLYIKLALIKSYIYDVVSDMYKNGPDILLTHLKNLMKIILRHGIIPKLLLICSLRPIVKSNLEDVTSSSNYRAIAGGCLLLKLVDLVFLELEGSKLTFDQLQFAYQRNSSTTTCSWMVSSVIEHFNKKGTTVYAASMDMSKAFDMVNWRILFSDLLERNINPLFLRVITFTYENQRCQV